MVSDKRKIRVSIPWELNMAIIKIQATEEIGFDEACVLASKLIDENSGDFKKAVDSQVNHYKKSLLMSEVNKVKGSWMEKGYTKGLNEGQKDGYKKAELEYKITYPCSVCGGELVMKQGANDHETMKKIMSQAGWAHSSCLENYADP